MVFSCRSGTKTKYEIGHNEVECKPSKASNRQYCLHSYNPLSCLKRLVCTPTRIDRFFFFFLCFKRVSVKLIFHKPLFSLSLFVLSVPASQRRLHYQLHFVFFPSLLVTLPILWFQAHRILPTQIPATQKKKKKKYIVQTAYEAATLF